MQTNGKSNDKLFKETEEKVKQWLTDEDFKYGRNTNESGFVWSWDATGPGGFGCSFAQAVGHPESLWLALTMMLDPYQRDINALGPEQSKDLLFTLRQRLLALGIRFDLGPNLISITLREQVFTETMTRETFCRGLNRVRRSADCAKWTLDEKLPEPAAN